MLSYIYKISQEYERSHGARANVLYLNRTHFDHLRNEFSTPEDINTILQLLGMNIIVSDETIQPHLSRITHTKQASIVHHPLTQTMGMGGQLH